MGKQTVDKYLDGLGVPRQFAGKRIALVDRVRLAMASACQEGIEEGFRQCGVTLDDGADSGLDQPEMFEDE